MAEHEHPSIIGFDDLPHSATAHRFIGADHGDVPVSFMLVHTEPGGGPHLHVHPYHEVFVVEQGEATFRLGDESIAVGAGHVVVGPPDVPHAFTNTGTDELRLTAIHAADRFDAVFLEGPDAAPPAAPGPEAATS